MPDLNDPSPLIMTHYELIGFVGGCLGVLVAIVLDIMRRGRKSPQP